VVVTLKPKPASTVIHLSTIYHCYGIQLHITDAQAIQQSELLSVSQSAEKQQVNRSMPNKCNTTYHTDSILPETNDGILPIEPATAAVDETVDVLTTAGVLTIDWLQTTTDGVATGWYA